MSKEMLDLVVSMVVMVMTELPVQPVHEERQVLKVPQVKMAKQASVVNVGCLVTMGRVVVTVQKVHLVLLVPMEKLDATVPLGLSVRRVVMA